MIPSEKIAEIRERTDIVALVGEFVPLRRMGASFRGLCPFHSEKSPSFYVHPERHFFYCFGCQASGDVVAFLMHLEGRSFPDAVRRLAERAGVELRELDSQEENEYRLTRQRHERWQALVEAAGEYFVNQLNQHPSAAAAWHELEARGVTREAASAFRLGYAPPSWDSLRSFFAERNWSLADAEKVGLILARKGGTGYYDRFRHRLMFPIIDTEGHMVGFSGRFLPPLENVSSDAVDATAPKYANSPESPVFHKGAVLYGLHQARVHARREGCVLVCEGNFDLVAMHQAGFQNTVAPLGTAFTESHARLIKRFAPKVIFLFDGDQAGRKAVRAALPIVRRAALEAYVVTLPQGEDPDSFLRTRGADALRTLIATAPGIVDVLIDDAAQIAAGDAPATAKALDGLSELLNGVDSPVEFGLYVERIARKFGIRDLKAVERHIRKGARRTDVPEQRSSRPPVQERRNVATMPSLEAELVGALLDQPELLDTDEAENLKELLTSEELRAIFQAALCLYKGRRTVDAATLIETVSEDEGRGWLRERLVVQKFDEAQARHVLEQGIQRLARQHIEKELPRLRRSILEARKLGDDNRATDLTRQHVALFHSAKRLIESTKR